MDIDKLIMIIMFILIIFFVMLGMHYLISSDKLINTKHIDTNYIYEKYCNLLNYNYQKENKVIFSACWGLIGCKPDIEGYCINQQKNKIITLTIYDKKDVIIYILNNI